MFPLLPAPPMPDDDWMHRFVDHLRARRTTLSRFTARHLAPQAFEAMFLLTPLEAAELWDARMSALLPSWRRMR